MSALQNIDKKQAVTGYAPSSVSLFFKPLIHSEPKESRSPGCAICFAEGVYATVTFSDHLEVIANGKLIEMPTVQTVVEKMADRPVRIDLKIELPIGCGFGISGGCALAAAFALNELFGGRHDAYSVGKIAHEADVIHGTGIGDVAAQMLGGLVYRACKNSPLDARRFMMNEVQSRTWSFRAGVFGTLSTGSIMRDENLRQQIVASSNHAIDWLDGALSEASQREHAQPSKQETSAVATNIAIEELFQHSRKFALSSGLIAKVPEVEKNVHAIVSRGGEATMAMLGKTILAVDQDPSQVRSQLNLDNQEDVLPVWYPLHLSNKGAGVVV